MSDVYKLVFRGELAEGQHPAVVRRKLAQLLGLDEPQLDRLFSGPVVVKATADAQTADRLESVFQKAGARLMRFKLAPADPPAPELGAPSDRPARTEEPVDAGEPRVLNAELLPVGSDILREDEREAWQPRHVDTSHLALLVPGAQTAGTEPAPPRLVDPDLLNQP
jgi:hypothetical protein